MDLFHVVDDAAAILRFKGGLFRQTKVYRRGDVVYAGVSGGFLKLLPRGNTSNPNVSWIDSDVLP